PTCAAHLVLGAAGSSSPTLRETSSACSGRRQSWPSPASSPRLAHALVSQSECRRRLNGRHTADSEEEPILVGTPQTGPDPGTQSSCPGERPDRATEMFVSQRNLLFTVAYEILGSASDAEDVLQETWLRWAGVDHDSVQNQRAYLVRI